MQSLESHTLNAFSKNIQLTTHQKQVLERMTVFTKHHLNQDGHSVFVLMGDAGTGKSLILNQLFTELAQEVDEAYFLVNHPELLKVYRELAGETPHMLKKYYQRPTSFINKLHKQQKHVNLTVIDEAHLLLSKADHYNNYYGDNQLKDIIQLSKVTIVVFDPHQVLRTKSFWTKDRLLKLIEKYPHDFVHLKEQFRMQAGPKLMDWLDHFIDGDIIGPVPTDVGDYDFRIYSDAQKMFQQIIQKNDHYGLSRMTSTSGYPSTLDGGKHLVNEGNFHLPWDQYNFTSTPWAEQPQTINEVGSIYTVQGFDLNYIGIIIGPPFYLTADNRLGVDSSKVTDVEIFKHRQDLSGQDYEQSKEILLRNSLNVLLRRGIRGMYLHAHDPKLESYLEKMIQE
ncbi:DUF2075 domain-containing protein [Lentilactobacillus hilgardii]|uniref:DUF2075 domain-containing protein n=1 Tax=Lentilactobacillus hilgardii TaxID=1588 RepID=UPI00019C5A07|nr:DUF2075 domain-containing protein [Lentilactobacillus hilgardii]EEI19260.1 hypothetical protein HMPREF0497_1870 [Lentilactobacillus buchneri ATCC 11577]MCP9332911.1 DUF2075 domain-containing protein [Lentilactobacillus hilgardii]MCP9349520.1 DUF2075 domain-containing protein [Lentilactobacillus hilgardii]MCP9352388.1 DUF2075 domain-containing protein [Lentilactobacillus hilgardii]MCT3395815.1 DUF2075 domain-containing protein [Lentilactobacillus hilgardii]